MGVGLRPNDDLGPYYVGDNVPDWVWTVGGLVDSSLYDGATLDLDDPTGTDFALGTDSFALAVVDSETLTVTYTADTTKTFTVAGRYTGQLAILIGTRRFTVQRFVFDVKEGAYAT